MAHEGGRRMLVAACALVAAAGLTACRSDDGARVAAPSAGRASTSAGSPAVPRTPAGRHPLVSAAERWIEYPDEAPDGVTDAGLLLNQRARGPRTVPLPDLRRSRELVMTLACVPDGNMFQLDLEDADGESLYTMVSGCPGLGAARTPPLDPARPPVSIRVEVPPSTDYYVTVYGVP